MNLSIRPRRLRQSAAIRALASECSYLQAAKLILPMFIIDESIASSTPVVIPSMPDCFRYTVQQSLPVIETALSLGINCFALFPVVSPQHKSTTAQAAYTTASDGGLIPQAILSIKRHFPEACLIGDLALDPFTDHGHDGIQNPQTGEILNDETVSVLCQQALCYSQAGVDILAPSDMMDGRVAAIRQTLDRQGYHDKLIMAYSAKYASAFYGPFRDALHSHPQGGTDKKTYQMSYYNAREAEKEVLLDIAEGADFVMVKPGLSYLDIVYRVKQISRQPVIAYAVSGEYAMIKAAAQNAWLDERAVVMEMLASYFRAGADAVLSYHALDCARWLRDTL